MSWEEERNVYIGKLERVDQGIRSILELKSNRIVDTEMCRKLTDLQKKAQTLLPKLKKNEFEIAVVGLEKAGKSTFSNALIGKELLPTDDQRCTFTSTCVRPAQEGEQDSVEVFFYTEREFEESLQDKLKLLEIPDAQNYTLDTLTLDKYRQLYEKCTHDIKRAYGDSVNLDVEDILTNKKSLREFIGLGPLRFNNAQVTAREHYPFIKDPDHAIAVKDVVVYSSRLTEMPNAVRYDVPGFDSPTAMHEEQTLKKMFSADAIITVANASAPSLVKASLDIFRKSEPEDGTELRDKLFVFANKADLAGNLEKNKEVTYAEWITTRKILLPQDKDRFVFGSARNLMGIEEIRSKLKTYCMTTRFEVLKRRINRILSDVVAIFEDTKKRFSITTSSFSNSELNKLVLRLYSDLHDGLKKQLHALRREITSNALQKPLSENISQYIKETVTVESYALTDEEIDNIHNEITGVGEAQQPENMDGEMRKERFSRMYNDFKTAVLRHTDDQHTAVCNKIQDIFETAAHVKDAGPEADTLRAAVRKFCALESNPEESYFHSLTERFARDLFEIQIKFMKSIARVNKFRESVANYLSLGVFYNYSANKDTYMNISPADSPLWRILLYPDSASIPSLDAMIEKLKELTGFQKISNNVKSLLEKSRLAHGAAALYKLEEAVKDVMCISASTEVIFSSLVDALRDLAAGGAACEDDFTLSDILSGNITAYTQAIAARRGKTYDYETVKQEFNDDIRALQIVLQNAFVPAVDIDTAFCAREIKFVEDIIGRLDEDTFHDFVAENADFIESARIGEIKAAEAQKAADMAVMNEIQAILNKIMEMPKAA